MSSGPEKIEVLEVASPITIRTISNRRTEFLEALQAHDAVALSIPDDATVDLAGVQLIVSARVFAHRHDLHLRLSRPAGGTLRVALERGGFLPPASPEDAEFWLHEGGEQ